MLIVDDKYIRASIDNIIGYTASYLSTKYDLSLGEVLKRIYMSDFIVLLKDLRTQYYNEDIMRLVEIFESEII